MDYTNQCASQIKVFFQTFLTYFDKLAKSVDQQMFYYILTIFGKSVLSPVLLHTDFKSFNLQ